MSDELIYAILFNVLTAERPAMCTPMYDDITASCFVDLNPCRDDSRCNVGEKRFTTLRTRACIKSLPEGKPSSVMQSECVLCD